MTQSIFLSCQHGDDCFCSVNASALEEFSFDEEEVTRDYPVLNEADWFSKMLEMGAKLEHFTEEDQGEAVSYFLDAEEEWEWAEFGGEA